jgi:hypothetical protein
MSENKLFIRRIKKTKQLQLFVPVFRWVLPVFFRRNLLRIGYGMPLILLQNADFRVSGVRNRGPISPRTMRFFGLMTSIMAKRAK